MNQNGKYSSCVQNINLCALKVNKKTKFEDKSVEDYSDKNDLKIHQLL